MRKTKSPTVFNPVKEDTSGIKAKRAIWSTDAVNLALKGIEQGKKLTANPFYENNTKLLKGDLVFQRTPEEIEEWLKCKNDILYFVENYCKLMTPEGIKNIKLRDYQKKYLKHLEDNRLSIYLACRQCGKCNSFITNVLAKIDDSFFKNIHDYKLKTYLYDNYYIKEKDCYNLPLFELYNLYDNSFKWKIQYHLYKFLYKYEQRKTKKRAEVCIKLIYGILNLLNTNSDKKLIKSFSLNGIKVANENGWTDATHIHMTKPFEIYHLELENGMTLDCADEHIVFVNGYEEKWVKDLSENDFVITSEGLSKVKRIERTGIYVNMCDMTVDNNRHSYYTNNILSHNTTTSAVFMLHYICFNVDKNALVLANKLKTSKEVLDKAKKIYIELPFFLRAGIYKWNECEIVLDNGCRLMCEATTINSGISFTFHCVLWDEAAHVAPNIIDKFYNNLFPTITAGKARFMITSTQNGYNLFYRLYKAAEAGESEYKAFKTDWYEVPEWNPETKLWEPRDEKWHQLQVANYGSEEAFNAQFGTNFDISTNTLISRKKLNKCNSNLYEFVNKDLYGIPLSDCYFWKPDYEPMEDLKKDYIVITVDLSEGIGGDYTIFLIHKMIDLNIDKLECIGYFRSSTHIRENCTYSLQYIICTYMNQEHLLLSYEKNTYGELFYRDIMDNIDKDQLISKKFDTSILVKYYNESGSRYVIGVKLTSGNKSSHCLLFKNSFEMSKYICMDTIFMSELGNFVDDGTGHFKASFGHDDLVMAAIQTEFVKSTLQYKILRDEFTMGLQPTNDDIYNPFESQFDYINDDINSLYKRFGFEINRII